MVRLSIIDHDSNYKKQAQSSDQHLLSLITSPLFPIRFTHFLKLHKWKSKSNHNPDHSWITPSSHITPSYLRNINHISLSRNSKSPAKEILKMAPNTHAANATKCANYGQFLRETSHLEANGIYWSSFILVILTLIVSAILFASSRERQLYVSSPHLPFPKAKPRQIKSRRRERTGRQAC